ncbi:L-rhamnose catabolism isomerase [Pseudoalteromonas sp. SR43-2]|uniref:L-rhamnose catabolism isomerase n=1 Tax=Pseudoalteromonas sp. SR43-2 TaxID=2760944 RepID=UPI0015FDCD45|nr:L-rhamnose catabolism isomerase [Pseudoalteromonas sp. SR43-2]MBB1379281.1 L-rhamnose catabolism isomerase [Pseudoalteromonas sp. SR43-2]|tara:strand:+ start:3934 stop:5226 length:1293 start_codon:yes stop_codon:yes gene_type:complete
MTQRIDKSLIADENAQLLSDLNEDYQALGNKLARNDINIEDITEKAQAFQIAVPSWGTGTGGTRFARFPGEGEPRNIWEKLEDSAVINDLSQCTERVSPHFPWDKVDDFTELKQFSDELNLSWDSINSNTFQDQPGQEHSFKYGSLSNTSAESRDLAIAHNLDCIEWGKALGSKTLTVWVGDGSNHPGQQHFQSAFERYLESMKTIYAGLPSDWELHIEHKMFEPAFYSTIIQDWGSNILAAMELGPQAKSLVDLGHHAPNVNIEMIVSRLIQFKKLGGFHFNDSKYGDDDLDSGSLHPYQQFLIFNELVDAQYRNQEGFNPNYMLDQSHNVTDPIESLMNSAASVQRSFVSALLVDREKLSQYQQDNDALMASNTLKNAFNTDVSPILAMARLRKGGAIDPIATYRKANYRSSVASKRPSSGGNGSGIV